MKLPLASAGVEAFWRDWIEPARIAIGAMREPTEAMALEGLQTLPFGPSSPAMATVCYRAMIDAALSEGAGET